MARNGALTRIQIGGKKRPVYFGMATFSQIGDERDLSLQQAMAFDPATSRPGDLVALVRAALAQGARKAGEEFDASHYEVADWLDEVDQDELGRAYDAMNAAQEAGEDEEAPDDEGN